MPKKIKKDIKKEIEQYQTAGLLLQELAEKLVYKSVAMARVFDRPKIEASQKAGMMGMVYLSQKTMTNKDRRALRRGWAAKRVQKPLLKIRKVKVDPKNPNSGVWTGPSYNVDNIKDAGLEIR